MGRASGGGGPRIGPSMAPPPFIGTWDKGRCASRFRNFRCHVTNDS